MKSAKSADADTAITFWIDSYGDIFSDFDPRPFGDRAVSDDFIVQVKKVSREVKGKITRLRILVPEGSQNKENEQVIQKRLQRYFSNLNDQLVSEVRAMRMRGLYFVLAGVVLMIIASYIAYLKLSGFSINLVLVLTEPAGWFFFWTGLDYILSFAKAKRNDIYFYGRMSGARIEFNVYK